MGRRVKEGEERVVGGEVFEEEEMPCRRYWRWRRSGFRLYVQLYLVKVVLGSVRHHAESGVRLFVCVLVWVIHVKYLNQGTTFFPLDETNVHCYPLGGISICLQEEKKELRWTYFEYSHHLVLQRRLNSKCTLLNKIQRSFNRRLTPNISAVSGSLNVFFST